MRRSNSHQRNKLAEAKRVVGEALGDTAKPSQPPGAKYVPEPARARPERRPSGALLVLTKGDAAARLGISVAEIERLIASGRLRGLPTGYAVTVPSEDVERLRTSVGR